MLGRQVDAFVVGQGFGGGVAPVVQVGEVAVLIQRQGVAIDQ